MEEIPRADLVAQAATARQRLFPNIDGIQFLTHEGGSAASRRCAIFVRTAGRLYNPPNVAGATVLSLG